MIDIEWLVHKDIWVRFPRPCHAIDNILDKEVKISIHTICWILNWVVDVSIEDIFSNIFNDDHPKIVIIVSRSCTITPLKHLWLLTKVKHYLKTHIKWYKCMVLWIICYFLRCFWRPNILDMGNLSAYNTLLESVLSSHWKNVQITWKYTATLLHTCIWCYLSHYWHNIIQREVD